MKRSFETVQLGTIEIFIHVAEALNFAQAAKELGLGAPAVSRSIARLEARLGVQLFVRSTRQVRLTDAGQLYLDECRQALNQIVEVENALLGSRKSLAGRLRISVPTTYGHYRLLPVLPEFMALYPDLNVEVNISNQNIDFVDQGFDLAIRMGNPPDSSLIVRKVEDATLGVFVAPGIIKRHGEPKLLADLEDLPLIAFELPSTRRPLPWLFREGGQDLEVKINSRLIVSEDVLGTVNYALNGGGFVQSYHFIAQAYLEAGRLIEVLKPYAGRSRPFSILYPQKRNVLPQVKAFVEFVLTKFKA
jgi:DNA-binding transcriptional LysR family regulator